MAKLVNLDIVETSGVDHPAHLDEGWLVMKAESAGVMPAESVEARVIDESSTESGPESDGPTVEELTARVVELEALVAELRGQIAEQPEPEPDMDELAKAAPPEVAAELEALRERVGKAEGELAAERDAKALAKATGFVTGLDRLSLDPAEAGPLVKGLREAAPDLAAQVEAMLSAVNAQVDAAGLFAELGKSAPMPVDGVDRLDALVKARAESDGISVPQAWRRVLATPDGAALYAEHRAGV